MKNRMTCGILRAVALVLLLCGAVLCISCGGPEKIEKKDYSFTVNGTRIAIDDDVAPILAALGAWKEYSESNSCAFVGLDKVYTYAGFELQTYPKDGKDYVYMIEIYDDTVTNEEGIAVGSSREDAIAAYGQADKETSSSLTYNGQKMHLILLLREDGSVGKIQYWKN